MNALKEYRTTKTKKSPQDMAEAIGVSLRTYYGYEAGETTPPPLVMKKIFEVTKGAVDANAMIGITTKGTRK